MNDKNKPIVINEMQLTKKMFMTYARITYYKFRYKFRLWALSLFLLTCSLAGLLVWLWNQPLWSILPLALSIYFLYMFFFGYQYSGGAAYRNLKEFYGDPIQMKVCFYDQFFRIETQKGSNDFLYTQVSHCITRKNLSILIVGAKGIIQHGQVIDLQTFTEDDLEKFQKIISGINCKIC